MKITSTILKFLKYHSWYILFSSLTLLFLSGFGLKGGDYKAFMTLDYSDFSTVVERWTTWTSRTLVDWFTSLSVHHIAIFLIITFLLTWLLFYSINRILLRISNIKDSSLLRLIIGLSFLLFFNLGLFTSAGVIATTVGFLWTTSLLVYGSTLLLEKKPTLSSMIIKNAALVFATCMEQIAVIVLLGAFLYTAYQLINKNRKRILVVIAPGIIATLQIIHALLNPGNAARKVQEVITWFPQFDNIPLLRKLDTGFIDTMQHFFVNPFWILLALLLLAVYISIKRRLYIVSAVATFQLIVLFFYNSSQNYLVATVNDILTRWNIKNFDVLLSTNATSMTGQGLYSFIPDAYFIVMSIALVYILWKISRNTIERYLVFSILLVGLCSRLLMSLSPTLYASADRTFVFMILGVYMVFLYFLIQYLPRRKESS